MFTRPRCRRFEPLVTTQIRLRNLIKITGVNFHCDDDKNFAVYYTLHLSAFSKPFYTSDKLECRSKLEWPEINCQQINTSSHKFICIRLWRRDKKTKIQGDSCNDQMLFLWGVYFSGLVSVSGRDDIKLKDNTLLFHLFGETFTSPEQICDTIPDSCDQNSDKFSSSSFNGSNGASPPRSIESMHENGSVTVMEVINESKYLKVRFAQLEFPKNEVQPSYTIEKLLQIQEAQRRIKSRLESSKMLADRICTKSAACLNLELIMSKPVFYEPQKQPGMGRTLSRLLSQQQAPPKPETILKVHELRVKIEGARFRIKLLTQERDRSRYNNRNLEMKREKLKDENTETETMIWNSLRALSRENPKAGHEKLALQQEVLVNVRLALGETKQCLLRELNEIYAVKKNASGQFTINGIHLPDAEMYSESTSSPTEISIALGYVAHAVTIIARILNIPLRNPVKYEGSRSRILDNVKILPPSDRM
jgi:UV radiation resistance-associated gene protein